MKAFAYGFWLACCVFVCSCSSSDSSSESHKGGDKKATSQTIAEVSQLVGGAGLQTPRLEPGTFLGVGGQLQQGDRVSVPKGTLAQIRLANQVQLNLREETEITLGVDANALTLNRGELVVELANHDQQLEVKAGKDQIIVSSGLVRLQHYDDEGAYAAIDGTMSVTRDGKQVDLTSGAMINTPFVQNEPVISAKLVEDVDWISVFEHLKERAMGLPRGVGSLKARAAGSSYEYQPLKLAKQSIQVSVVGHLARTSIEQEFKNEASQVLEGIYRFPLPSDASISGLELLVGDKWVRAEMVEKKRAERIFQKIVDATVPRDPALLEWDHGNIFKMRIFPIPAKGSRSIRISYTQVLPVVGNAMRYRYPLGGGGATGTSIDALNFNASIDRQQLTEAQINGIRTALVDAEKTTNDQAVLLHAHQEPFVPVYDIGFDIPVNDDAPYQQTYLAEDGKAYFMLALRPQFDDGERARKPVDYAFVLDRSYSTTPELWAIAAAALQALIHDMNGEDRFIALACDTACEDMPGGVRQGGEKAASEFKEFAQKQLLLGASDIASMITTASKRLEHDARQEAQRVVVYLGDGIASAGPLAPHEVAQSLDSVPSNTRIEAIALGARADLSALRAIAEMGGGDVTRLDPNDDPAHVARLLRLRARVPSHSHLTLSLPEGLYDVHPAKVPAMRNGDELIIVGKLRHPVDGDISLGDDGVDQHFPVSLSANTQSSEGNLLPRTWAREQIDQLTRTQGDKARSEIVSLSQHYTVISRYTALLALENDAMYKEFHVARNNAGEKEQPADLEIATDASSFAERQQLGDVADKPISADDESDMASAQTRAPSSSSSRMRKAVASAARPKMKPAQSAPSAPSAPAPTLPKPSRASMDSEPFSEGASSSGGPIQLDVPDGPFEMVHPPMPRPRRRHVMWTSRAASKPSEAVQKKISALVSARDENPTSRAAHEKLVRTSAKAGDNRTNNFAIAWLDADPEHPAALRAFADALARNGDAHAMRAYASAVEVRPFSAQYQKQIAAGHARLGDHERACAHRRALVSIDPRKDEYVVDLAKCWLDAGQASKAKLVLDQPHEAIRNQGAIAKLRAQIDQNTVSDSPAYLHPYAALRITLAWQEPNQKLDIALIDYRGRRLSALWADVAAVRQSPGQEILTLRSLSQPLQIEVTHRGGPGGSSASNRDAYSPNATGRQPTSQSEVHASLKIEVGGNTRTYPVDVAGGSIRVATVTRSLR